jgi:hypothetical protein
MKNGFEKMVPKPRRVSSRTMEYVLLAVIPPLLGMKIVSRKKNMKDVKGQLIYTFQLIEMS